MTHLHDDDQQLIDKARRFGIRWLADAERERLRQIGWLIDGGLSGPELRDPAVPKWKRRRITL